MVARTPIWALFAGLVAAALAAHGQVSIVAAGKGRAAALGTAWEVRDVEHPVMGPIKVGVPKSGVSTTVGDLRIVSAAFVSCEKKSGKIAIELANSIESDTRGGLRPASLPKLICNPARTEIATAWLTSELGDTLARGLSPAAIRRCSSIDVLQDVALPASAPVRSQSISMELAPYSRELDEIFVACGERTAYAAPVPERAGVTAASKAPGPTAQSDANGPWQSARTIGDGNTNVRAEPGLNARVVAHLPANAAVLVQPAIAPWWRVKATKGKIELGYVREDRLTFK